MRLSLLPSTFMAVKPKPKRCRRHCNGSELASDQQWRMLCALYREENGAEPWEGVDSQLEDDFGIDEATLTVAEFLRVKRELEGDL